MDIEKIKRSLSETNRVRVAVFGDYALDKYLYIDPARDEPSAETGLTAYQVHRRQLSAGVGGTIANNLRALGVQVSCVGVVGEDGEGYELLRELKKIGADTSFMVCEKSMCTSTYIKPMRKDAKGVYRELNRLDLRNFTEPPGSVQDEMLAGLEAALKDADAVLVTDQFYQRNQGAVTDYIREKLGELAQKHSGRIFYADSRSFADEYRNMIVKCNNLELFRKFGGGEGDPENLEEIIKKGEQIARRNGRLLFVTMGSRGMVVFGKQTKLVPAFRVSGEVDIVGAGDAANAGIVTGLALGLEPEEAALLGCCVSSITIQQIGTTGTADPEEVRKRLTTFKQ